MSRDHRKLKVFHEAHGLTLAIYQHTRDFPRDEWFGLRAQMRRAAAAVPTNVVEGNARRTTAEYVNFLNVALASASELAYLVVLSHELGYLTGERSAELQQLAERVVRQLQRLTQRMEQLLAEERGARRRGGRTPGP